MSSSMNILAQELGLGSNFERRPLHQQIADKVEAAIRKNEFNPGDQLPSEYEFAKAFNVSRVTVHQAMLVLSEKGLVEIRTGSGLYITDMPLSIVTNTIERYVTMGDISLDDLLTFREIVEPEAAALAAVNASAEDITLLEEFVREIEESFKENHISNCAKADQAFHEVLWAASHNSLIYANLSGIQSIVLDSIYTQIKTFLPESGILAHRPIFEAVAARDANHARDAMRVHMANTRQQIQQIRNTSPELLVEVDEDIDSGKFSPVS